MPNPWDVVKAHGLPSLQQQRPARSEFPQTFREWLAGWQEESQGPAMENSPGCLEFIIGDYTIVLGEDYNKLNHYKDPY